MENTRVAVPPGRNTYPGTRGGTQACGGTRGGRNTYPSLSDAKEIGLECQPEITDRSVRHLLGAA
eukprot:2516129-Rhodomonas_salina.1